MLQVISLLLENKPGALMRVTGLLSPARLQHREPDGRAHARPGALAHDHRGRRRAAQRAQVIKQMNKLINVLQATDLTEAPAGSPRAGAGAHPHAAGIAHRGAERSRDLRRPRGRFLAPKASPSKSPATPKSSTNSSMSCAATAKSTSRAPARWPSRSKPRSCKLAAAGAHDGWRKVEAATVHK